MCEQIEESRLECKAAKAELRAYNEKMEATEADLASKRIELASLDLAIDEAARKRRTEQKVRVSAETKSQLTATLQEIEMLVYEREKTERGIQKMGRNYRELSADVLDMELQILEKGDELAEMKSRHEYQRKRLRGVPTGPWVFGERTHCKDVCLEKEKTINE